MDCITVRKLIVELQSLEKDGYGNIPVKHWNNDYDIYDNIYGTDIVITQDSPYGTNGNQIISLNG